MAAHVAATQGAERSKTPDQSSPAMTPPETPKKAISTSNSPQARSPRNSENSQWLSEQKRRSFVAHLKRWSLNHDSSAHFNGTISLWNPLCCGHTFDLGKSVKCVLTDKRWTDARKHIVVRLFAPRGGHSTYRMVIRSGAGWVNARQFFDKEYFNRRTAEKTRGHFSADLLLTERSEMLGPKSDDKDTVSVQPLFRNFLQLPTEIQQYIFGLVIGKTKIFRACRNEHTGFAVYRNSKSTKTQVNNRSRPKEFRHVKSSTKLSTLFLISKSTSEHLISWIYKTTTFHFANQGFTNFMWLSGPHHRALINQITLSFGFYALVHCIRWFAPDPIFQLFDPQMSLQPPAMQYFWRCQIRDLASELHLSILTIDIAVIPPADIPFIVRILQLCFASVGKVLLCSSGAVLNPEDTNVRELTDRRTWGELCADAYVRYRSAMWHDQCFSVKRRANTIEELERDMAANADFFNQIAGAQQSG